MKTQDFCPLCDNAKIIQDSNPENWICSNHHCMFNNVEKVKAVSDLTAQISLHFGRNIDFDEVVSFARPKCADNFLIKSVYVVPGNDFKQDIKVAKSKHERYGNRFLK
jgi:hypothetical protein